MCMVSSLTRPEIRRNVLVADPFVYTTNTDAEFTGDTNLPPALISQFARLSFVEVTSLLADLAAASLRCSHSGLRAFADDGQFVVGEHWKYARYHAASAGTQVNVLAERD